MTNVTCVIEWFILILWLLSAQKRSIEFIIVFIYVIIKKAKLKKVKKNKTKDAKRKKPKENTLTTAHTINGDDTFT